MNSNKNIPGSSEGGSHVDRPTLKRKVSRFGFFALAFGSMIGVGWITAIGGWLKQAGPLSAMLAFVAGGAIMVLIGLCYAEATPMLPVAGGEIAYAYKAFGTFKSFVVGWCLAFGYVAISGFEAISIGKVLGFMIPELNQWTLYEFAGGPVYAPHLLMAIVFTGLITALHYRGVESAAAVQRWLTFAFVLVTFIFIVCGLVGGSFENLKPWFPEGETGVFAGFLMVLVTAPFWFVGFDTIPQAAEEADSSVAPRQLATLILISLVAAVGFYVVLILSVSMTVPWQSLLTEDLPAAKGFEAAFGSPLLVNLVLIAALLGLFTSWNGFFLAGSRVLFALGRGHIITKSFGETHPRFGSPHRAIIFTGVLTALAPLMGRDALIAFINAGSFCIAFAFLGVALSVSSLRKSHPDLNRPFRIPGGQLVPRLAAVCSIGLLAAMVIPGSPAALAWPHEILIVLIFLALGVIFWFSGKPARKTISESERAYLILEE